jgi:predicted nucleotidyltransferase
MTFGLPQSSLDKIKNVISNHNGIKEVIIYGSRAKGNFREGSDIDMTIKGDLSHSDMVEISVELDDLNLPWMIDLSLYDKIGNENLRRHIDEFGIRF